MVARPCLRGRTYRTAAGGPVRGGRMGRADRRVSLGQGQGDGDPSRAWCPQHGFGTYWDGGPAQDRGGSDDTSMGSGQTRRQGRKILVSTRTDALLTQLTHSL